jgi:hypothetical protein
MYHRDRVGTSSGSRAAKAAQRGVHSCLFEQAFSDDGGKTWELNWIAKDTRVTGESRTSH